MKGVVDLASKTVSPSRLASNAEEWTRQLSGMASRQPLQALPRLIAASVASVLGPALGRITLRAAIARTIADQAALACALDRYRLANGQFPETLDALTPRFISRAPNDVITGQRYKYRRTDDGQFILYSVGWNEKDDGGVPGETLFDQTQGDWVWSYTAN
jgi:type II secretory pathway pseudopilin PulG